NIHRLGGITADNIKDIVDCKITLATNHSSPGNLKSHYAPNTKTYFGTKTDLMKLLEKFNPDDVIVINYSDFTNSLLKENQFVLSESRKSEEAAANLFSTMRKADRLGKMCIFLEKLPIEGLGSAINER